MAELVYSVQSRSLDPPKPPRPEWSPLWDGLTADELRHEFDEASEQAHLDELQRIAFLATKVDQRQISNIPMAIGRYKFASIPLYERVFALQSGFEPGEVVGAEVDKVHEATVDVLKQALDARSYATSTKIDRDLTGAISELTVAALLNREGRNAEYIALAATTAEDEGSVTPEGHRTGFDFKVYPAGDISKVLKLQVKTTLPKIDSPKPPYASDILVISMTELTKTHLEAYSGLPRALVHYKEMAATDAECELLNTAHAVLMEKIHTHYLEVQENQPTAGE